MTSASAMNSSWRSFICLTFSSIWSRYSWAVDVILMLLSWDLSIRMWFALLGIINLLILSQIVLASFVSSIEYFKVLEMLITINNFTNSFSICFSSHAGTLFSSLAGRGVVNQLEYLVKDLLRIPWVLSWSLTPLLHVK